ncbi:MAG: hypothetical protein Q8R00_02500 [Candidatus Nanoarchaeia archaeon]|nr:hypothetical protein [Candidatus Nanoarchaeia archaeon]
MRVPEISRKTDLLRLYKNVKTYFKTIDFNKSEISSTSPPAVFVGRVGYPNINVGILAPPDKLENTWLHDAPELWSKEDYSIEKIINLRAALLNSRFKANIKSTSKFLDISQEVGMAYKPVNLEIDLVKKPRFSISIDKLALPMGPSGQLKKVQITENTKIHTKVDKVHSDTDLKAAEAINYLYKNNFDVNFLSKILSIGTIGLKSNRKLVPTRWSITATDDTIGKQLIKEIQDYPAVNEYYLYHDQYIGNHYFVLFLPDVFSYELFESYMPLNLKNQNELLQTEHDYEYYYGRKVYAKNTVGGYYACRIGILEKLKEIKRQATVIVFRFVTSQYTTPLGVWVCRESTRRALNNKTLKFQTQEQLIKYLKELILGKFNYNIENLLNHSEILKYINQQTKLSKWSYSQ